MWQQIRSRLLFALERIDPYCMNPFALLAYFSGCPATASAPGRSAMQTPTVRTACLVTRAASTVLALVAALSFPLAGAGIVLPVRTCAHLTFSLLPSRC